MNWFKRFKKSTAYTQANIVCTVIIAIATVTYTIIAHYQLRAMNNQLGAMKRSSEESSKQFQVQLQHFDAGLGRTELLAKHAGEQADANHIAAIAAQDAAATAKESLRSVQRALVVPLPHFSPIYKPNTTELQAIEIQPQVTNSGVTPTKNLLLHASEQYLQTPDLPADFAFPDLWDAGTPHVATHFFLGPKDTAATHTIVLQRPIVEAIADKKVFLYLYGWARYNDIFPGTKEHITKYCWRIDFRRQYQNQSGDESFKTETPTCAKNNCYDEECTAKR